MPDSVEILRLRALLCFLKDESNTCTVTKISRVLGEEKYTITRILTSLEKDGLVDRSNSRNPKLTALGAKEAIRYQERIETTMNHLMYEGVDTDNAQKDALHWALYNSDRTMEVIRATEERYRVKYELRDLKSFSGASLCRRMHDGTYQFPFLIYREHVQNGTNLSMANAGFEQPCILSVENGVGTIQLRTHKVTAKSAQNGHEMCGKVQHLCYLDNGSFIEAENNGNVISFPASVLNFMNIGSGVGQILHGSVCLKMQCSVGVHHMPESTAIFTVLI